MKRKKGQLRAQAGAAKSRLVTGFWALDGENRAAKVQTYNIYYGKTDAEEEQFYVQVAALLGSGEDPLSQLLDREHMGGLDASGRERYVLSVGARVRKCIERYNQVS